MPRLPFPRPLLVLALPLLLSVSVLLGCPPKLRSGTDSSTGTGTGKATVGASSNSRAPAWAADARLMLSTALGAGRFFWADPPVLPGERLKWRVVATAAPDVVMEVGRSEASAGVVERWVVAQSASKREVEADFGTDGARPIRLSFKENGAAAGVADRDEEVAPLFPARVSGDEKTFLEAGGNFLGNEVVRVAAGEFRARHGVIARDGSVFHLYVARAVPGGLVKMEVFAEGAIDPALVMELQEYVRLKSRPQP